MITEHEPMPRPDASAVFKLDDITRHLEQALDQLRDIRAQPLDGAQ